MSMQDKGIDFIAYDDIGRVILLGEVKSRVGTSGEWAARFRRNMLAHDIARTGDERVKHDPSMRWLAESGLIDSLENARIEINPA